MAAQVLSGEGNVTYTNSTGQNVRLVINYLENDISTATITYPGFSVSIPKNTKVGKTLAYIDYGYGGSTTPSVAMAYNNSSGLKLCIPLEVALANGQTFSVNNPTNSSYIKGYNIIIIPEAG